MTVYYTMGIFTRTYAVFRHSELVLRYTQDGELAESISESFSTMMGMLIRQLADQHDDLNRIKVRKS